MIKLAIIKAADRFLMQETERGMLHFGNCFLDEKRKKNEKEKVTHYQKSPLDFELLMSRIASQCLLHCSTCTLVGEG